MLKKFLAVLLTVAMMLSMVAVTASAAEAPFTDTKGNWAENSIARWADYGVVKGTDNGQFQPGKYVTRSEFSSILSQMLRLKDTTGAWFYDIKGTEWYAAPMLRLASAGILAGIDGNAEPFRYITREQAFSLIARALNIPDSTSSETLPNVSPWAQKSVKALVERGIVVGVTTPDGVDLAPQQYIDKASIVSLLDRTITTYANKPGTYTNSADGFTIIATDGDVVVTGDVGGIVVTAAAEGGNVTVDDAIVADGVKVDAPKVNVTIRGSQVNGGMTITNKADGTNVSVAGGSSVDKITTAADDVVIDGNGVVDEVEVTGGSDVEVNTPGTTVTVDEGAENVTAGGEEVEAGEEVTTPGAGEGFIEPSTPSGPSVPSAPSKYGVVTATAVDTNTTPVTLTATVTGSATASTTVAVSGTVTNGKNATVTVTVAPPADTDYEAPATYKVDDVEVDPYAASTPFTYTSADWTKSHKIEIEWTKTIEVEPSTSPSDTPSSDPSTDPSGSGVSLMEGETTTETVKQTITITSALTEAPAVRTMTYKANDGATNPATADVTEEATDGTTYTVKGSNTFTRQGYTLTKWNTAADGSGTYYAFGDSVTVSANLTLYAVWEAVTTYTYPDPVLAKATNASDITVRAVTFSSGKITFGTGTVKKHVRSSDNVEGYWLGAAFAPAVKTVGTTDTVADGYIATLDGSDPAAGSPTQLEVNVIDDTGARDGVALYFDLATDDVDNATLKIQWYKGNDTLGEVQTYTFDATTNTITLDPPITPSPSPEATASTATFSKVSADTNLWGGKHVSDLHDDNLIFSTTDQSVEISSSVANSTLNFINNWNEFHESDPADQTGYFVAINVVAPTLESAPANNTVVARAYSAAAGNTSNVKTTYTYANFSGGMQLIYHIVDLDTKIYLGVDWDGYDADAYSETIYTISFNKTKIQLGAAIADPTPGLAIPTADEYVTSTVGSATTSDGVITVPFTAGVVKQHTSSQSAGTGYWIGFNLAAPTGAEKVKVSFEASQAALVALSSIRLDDVATDAVWVNESAGTKGKGVAFYANLADETPKTWVKLQWYNEDGIALGGEYVYHMDLSLVSKYADVADPTSVQPVDHFELYDTLVLPTLAVTSETGYKNLAFTTSNNLLKHGNENFVPGYWVCASFTVPTGVNKAKYAFGANTNVTASNDVAVTAGDTLDIWVDAADSTDPYMAIQWYKDTTALSDAQVYKFDMTGVQMATSGTLGTVAADEGNVGGNVTITNANAINATATFTDPTIPYYAEGANGAGHPPRAGSWVGITITPPAGDCGSAKISILKFHKDGTQGENAGGKISKPNYAQLSEDHATNYSSDGSFYWYGEIGNATYQLYKYVICVDWTGTGSLQMITVNATGADPASAPVGP